MNPPDINRDPLLLIGGAVTTIITEPTLVAQTAVAVCTLVPQEPPLPQWWPREQPLLITTDTSVGTVDELVADYKEGLVKAFQAITLTSPGQSGGNIPMTGEPSLDKQTRVLEQMGYVPGKAFRLPPTPYEVLAIREKQRADMAGFTRRQDAFERNTLFQLVHAYGLRRFRDQDSRALLPGQHSVKAIQALIEALTVLRDDEIVKEQRVG